MTKETTANNLSYGNHQSSHQLQWQCRRSISFVLKPKYGKKIEIHYVEDTKTGQRMDFKFKRHYGATSKPKD